MKHPEIAIAVVLADTVGALSLIGRICTSQPARGRRYTAEERLESIAAIATEALDRCRQKQQEIEANAGLGR